MKSGLLRLVLALSVVSVPFMPAMAAELHPPAGVKWGSSPQEVGYLWQKYYKFLGPQEGPDSDLFLHEQRYDGNFLGLRSDHIAPLFFAGQLFSIAVSYSPDPQNPAALIWDTLVTKLEGVYGKPEKKTRAMQLLSFHAILKLLPPEVDKNALLAMYQGADKDRRIGSYMLQDLQIQTGSWVPEAVWRFSNGAVLKVVMRAGGSNQFGLLNLKPAVIYSRYDQLK